MTRVLSLRDKLAHSWPPVEWQDVTVLVAVSGGADSVALLRGLQEQKTAGSGRLVAAHFNHRLRGAESAADEAFVAQLCQQLHLPLEIGRTDVAGLPASGDGIEAAAREARYAFLAQTADCWGARYVVTAHTADDQAETILLRILRGTGIRGLAGIPRARPLTGSATLLRPLLEVRRSEVLQYLRDLQQDYRNDASNQDPSYSRNRLRHELLPLLARDYNPRVQEALLRLGELAEEAQQVVDCRVHALEEQRVQVGSLSSARVLCSGLGKADAYLLRELLIRLWKRQGWPLQGMTQEAWTDLAALGAATSGKGCLPGNVSAEKQGEWLVLTRPPSSMRNIPG